MADDDTEIAAIVLAGGGSRRLGRDKAWVEVGGVTLLQRAVAALEAVASEVLVVGAPGRALPPLHCARPLRLLADPVADRGPLAGIATGLEACAAGVALVVGCDAPFLEPALLHLLATRAAASGSLIVPVHDGRPQLLCSAWPHSALAAVRAELARGARAVVTMLNVLDVELLPAEGWRAADPEGRSFVNVNTPEDLAAARAAIEG